jgi:hypothetical protein
VADRVILSIYQASAYGMLRDQVEVLVIASVSFGIIFWYYCSVILRLSYVENRVMS